tara:strand:- start:1289 stop:3091 length:1803 start_codon:yes stop_codon:yes gene_type:complete
MNIKNIRNFCIIAHIDHGKSTLADRILEKCNVLEQRDMKSQVLDDMDIERERGITIKSHPVNMNYKYEGVDYILNLIDTPGHVDFTYEVSRSMAACEGALLIVDASQGVEAQTVSNAYLAIESDLTIIPIINKIDSDNADIESASNQLIELLGCNEDELLFISAKNNIGIEDVLKTIINVVPYPEYKDDQKGTRALIFDSIYDQYRGVILYIRMFHGTVKKNMNFKSFTMSGTNEVLEAGTLKLKKHPKDELRMGDVGYIVTNIKNVSEVNVGDTITVIGDEAKEPLPGYKEIKPMVFCGMYPISSQDFEDLRASLEKLKLNDASLTFEPNTSTALGFGFRCGFLGPLHMEIIQERLEREFNMELISTSPTVSYEVQFNNGSSIVVNNPSDLPISSEIKAIMEPYIKAEIISPDEYIGNIMKICMNKRAKYLSTNYITSNKVQLNFEMPLSEVIYEFFESLKAATKGYASFDYEVLDLRPSKLQRLDIMISGEIVDALSIIVHRDKAYKHGSSLCSKLKNEIHRQQFDVPIQAAISSKIIARETVKALRKNVTAKCYGGDISRKRKLLEKQKEGKKRMKTIGRIELPQEAFLAVLKIDDE